MVQWWPSAFPSGKSSASHPMSSVGMLTDLATFGNGLFDIYFERPQVLSTSTLGFVPKSGKEKSLQSCSCGRRVLIISNKLRYFSILQKIRRGIPMIWIARRQFVEILRRGSPCSDV